MAESVRPSRFASMVKTVIDGYALLELSPKLGILKSPTRRPPDRPEIIKRWSSLTHDPKEFTRHTNSPDCSEGKTQGDYLA